MHNEPLGGIYGRYSMLTMGITEQVDVSVDGERVALLDVSPSDERNGLRPEQGQNGLEIRTPPIHIKAGPKRISVAFIQRLDGPVDDLVAPLENTLADVNISYGVTALPHMRDVSIVGPSVVTGVSETPSRKKIFTCRPVGANDEETVRRADRQEPHRAGVSGRSRAPKTSRTRSSSSSGAARPATSRAASAWRCSRFWSARASCSGSNRVRRCSRPLGAYRISDQDLATRLSFFLWGSGPDAELIKAGERRRPARAARRREAGAPHARRQAVRIAVDALRQPVAAAAGSREDLPGLPAVSAVRRHARAGDDQGDDALLRQHRARGSQRAGSDQRRLLVRQRAAREALRHPERHRQRIPPRAGAGVSPRPARPGQHPHARHRSRIARRRCCAASG